MIKATNLHQKALRSWSPFLSRRSDFGHPCPESNSQGNMESKAPCKLQNLFDNRVDMVQIPSKKVKSISNQTNHIHRLKTDLPKNHSKALCFQVACEAALPSTIHHPMAAHGPPAWVGLRPLRLQSLRLAG